MDLFGLDIVALQEYSPSFPCPEAAAPPTARKMCMILDNHVIPWVALIRKKIVWAI